MHMTFTCRQCGTCCMYMGDYIAIERQIGPFEFECCSVSTGTPFIARVDEDKREIFSDYSFPDQHPSACRFLRPDGNLIRCTIHRDSPAQCKFYRCVVMRVYEASGAFLGTVTGTLALHSEDPGLRLVWEEAKKCIPESVTDAEERLGKYLLAKGYRVE
jgi:Fe-S-cluster containining protein